MKIVSLFTFIIMITFCLNVRAQAENSADTNLKFEVIDYTEYSNADVALIRNMTNNKDINPNKVSTDQLIKDRCAIYSQAQANRIDPSRIMLLNTTLLPSNNEIASRVRSNPDVLDLSLSSNNLTIVKDATSNESILNNRIPQKFSLSQNYPNPFNPETKIVFNIVKSGLVKLTVFDNLGKEVETLVNEYLQPGLHGVSFNGSRLSSGVYYYRLEIDGLYEIKRMTLIK